MFLINLPIVVPAVVNLLTIVNPFIVVIAFATFGSAERDDIATPAPANNRLT